MRIPIKLLKRCEARYSMLPQNIAKIQEKIATNLATKLDRPEQVLKRRQMLQKVAPENLDDAFERYIGNNDLLPINFLEIGYHKSRAVGRIRYFDLTVNQNALATGFLISNDLVLSNHHVFQKIDSFRDPYIEFDYAFGVDGKEEQKIVFALDPKKFFYANPDLDFALIGINSIDESKAHNIQERGYLVLNPDTGKAGLGDFATIIQYPNGNWQQIALRENKILDLTKPEDGDSDAIVYSSDTSPGSSGSPVFNDQWQVIALHSAGVARKNKKGDYVDKDNNIIPPQGNTIDSSKIVWESNMGFRVSSIVKHLMAVPELSRDKYLQIFLDPSYTDAKSLSYLSQPIRSIEDKRKIPGNAPVSQQSTPPVYITINVGDKKSQVYPPAPSSGSPVDLRNDVQAAETKYEDEMDYSQCSGFDEHFMECKTPIPSLDRQLTRKIATYKSNPNQIVLRYFHYSTIFHSIRKMPVVSMINVEGNPADRKDTTARSDKWLRDNRIDYDFQLSDDFYKKSGFDKGHMSRREDAKWGITSALAEQAAQLTCMYTNACPQVPDINRAIYGYHGDWGLLEQIILERGAELEDGKTSKICVYNGPVFDDTDPVYKGVQIPLRFWKIVVWMNASSQAKTTCFYLTQEDLVSKIKFEDLHYDKEFVNHQCSVKHIEGLTKMTFDGIRDNDTFVKDAGSPHEFKILQSGDLEKLIKKHRK